MQIQPSNGGQLMLGYCTIREMNTKTPSQSGQEVGDGEEGASATMRKLEKEPRKSENVNDHHGIKDTDTLPGDNFPFVGRIDPSVRHVLLGAAVGTGALLAAPLALYAVGFTSGGVAAGSIAAAIQTPSTVAGGLFASCQSAGVLGLGVATKIGIGTTAGTITGVSSKLYSGHSGKEDANKTDQPSPTVEQHISPGAVSILGPTLSDNKYIVGYLSSVAGTTLDVASKLGSALSETKGVSMEYLSSLPGTTTKFASKVGSNLSETKDVSVEYLSSYSGTAKKVASKVGSTLSETKGVSTEYLSSVAEAASKYMSNRHAKKDDANTGYSNAEKNGTDNSS